MNEDNHDDVFNDEDLITIEPVDSTNLRLGRTIICKGTLVNNLKGLICSIAHILDSILSCEVKVYNTTEDDTFVIATGPIGPMKESKVKRLQKILLDIFEKRLIRGGFVEIVVLRDVEIYEDINCYADECIFKGVVSHEIPLKDDFAEIFTRHYDPMIEKQTFVFSNMAF